MMDILYDWNPWWTDLSRAGHLAGRARDWYVSPLMENMGRKHIITLAGIRRSGKTTIMYQVIEKLLKQCSPEDVLFVNADDERLRGLKDPLDPLFKEFFREIGKGHGRRCYIFIDEVQRISGWESVLKRYYDLGKNIKFIVSGSSSGLIDTDYSRLLTGRSINFRVSPLSFPEFLDFRKVTFISKDLRGTWEKNREFEDELISELERYMRTGGFPEVVVGEGDNRLLNEYFNAIIYRDIVYRFNVRDPQALELLAVYVMRNFANLMSFRSISQASGLSVDTAGEYLSYLEKAFMVSINKKFTRSSKGQMKRSSPVKVYATDLGMANSLILESMDTKGRWAETLAANEMNRTAGPMYYWRNGYEVDLLSPRTKEAVQVCYGNERENELKAFKELPFKGYARTIITKDEFDISKKIKRVPLWTFLLNCR